MKSTSLLDRVRIASPCPVPWDSMQGDDRVRFCSQCQLRVYNLSAMTAEEATEVVAAREGRLCAGFYRRADGTILTQDCPKGLAAVRKKVRRGLATAAGVLIFLGGQVAGAVGLGWLAKRTLPPRDRTAGVIVPDEELMISTMSFTGGVVCIEQPPPQPLPPSQTNGTPIDSALPDEVQ